MTAQLWIYQKTLNCALFNGQIGCYVNYISVKMLPKKKKKSTNKNFVLHRNPAFTNAKNSPGKPLQQRSHNLSAEWARVRAHKTRGWPAHQRKQDPRPEHGLMLLATAARCYCHFFNKEELEVDKESHCCLSLTYYDFVNTMHFFHTQKSLNK